MSMVRSALRILAVEALKGATIAGARVFDSRMADISPDAFTEDAKPMILIITDKDDGNALSDQNGGPPFGRSMELSLELAMVQRVFDGNEVGIMYPDTDARHEAALDFLEHQVMAHLGYADQPLPIMFRRFWRITKYDCHRQLFEETSMKVAARVLTLVCYSGDAAVLYRNSSIPPDTGYEVLPQPLQSVCSALPVGSSGRDICDLIVAATNPMEAAPFGGMDVVVDAGDNIQGNVPSTEERVKIDVEQEP